MIATMTASVYRELYEKDEKRLEKAFVYRWNSMYQTVEARNMNMFLNFNFPLNEHEDTKKFDFDYANWIMSDDNAHNEIAFMAYLTSNGMDVIILVSELEFRSERETKILESLMKVIQGRYGITYREIQCEEDIPDVPQDTDSPSIGGLYYLDLDRKRANVVLQSIVSELGPEGIKSFNKHIREVNNYL